MCAGRGGQLTVVTASSCMKAVRQSSNFKAPTISMTQHFQVHHVCAIIMTSHQVNSNIIVQGINAITKKKQYQDSPFVRFGQKAVDYEIIHFRDLFGTGDDACDDNADREDEYDEDEASSSK